MVVVKFQGGIGNQLFQYAFFRELQYRGKRAYGDFSAFDLRGQIRTYELEKVGISVDPVSVSHLRKLGICRENVIDKVIFRTVGRKHYIQDEYGQVFNPRYFELDNCMLDGFWQTRKYFPNVYETIKGEIYENTVIDDNNEKIMDELKRIDSVSIHIRFGDYVNNDLYWGICTQEYYKHAMDLIKSRIRNPKFFVITDDERAAAELIKDNGAVFLTNNRNENSYKDLFLISACRHHIMANSSFSWWGVMLDKQSEGMVISPAKWLNGVDTTDIWEESWIRL